MSGLTSEMHNVCQFVADYFGRQRKPDYSDWGICWNGYVGLVAEGGEIMESVITGMTFDDWYGVLEEATDAAELHLIEQAGRIDELRLREKFADVISRHENIRAV